MIHHNTVYIDKVINFDMKFLFTVGIDQCKLENGSIQEQQYFIKIWDLQALISGQEGYNPMTPGGICGGTIWEKNVRND